MTFWLTQLSLMGVYVTLVSSYDLIAGRAGLMSLSHAALFGVGAYTTALVMLHSPVHDALLLIPMSAVIAAVLSLPVAALSLRIRRDHFAVTSLGFALAFIAVLNNVRPLGLAEGLIGIPTMTVAGLSLFDPAAVTVFALVVAAVVVGVVIVLVRGSWGLRLAAVRDSERAAVSFGINPVTTRTSAVVVSGGGAGIAGSVYVAYALFVSPESFDLSTLALIVAMLGLGQTMGLAGYVIGPAVLVGASAALEYLHVVSLTVLGQLDQIAYGLVMVLAIRLVPRRRRRAIAEGRR